MDESLIAGAMAAETSISLAGHRQFKSASDGIEAGRQSAGGWLILLATIGFLAVAVLQALYAAGQSTIGFSNWRPVLYVYILWAIALGVGLVLSRGQAGHRALFVLPAVLFILSMAIFPTLFGAYIAFTDWNLSAFEGRKFNGIDNFVQLLHDAYFWNALRNMVFYVLAVAVEYAIAFGLALLLNQEIRARKFFRVVFLIPFMLSPVAVSWMVGKSMLEYRFGPVAHFARMLGWDNPAFFASPWIARMSIEALDAWVSIPFVMILLLAGLQAMPKEIVEAAKVDGAGPWQGFWKITFPLMLPVSITAIVLRIIFKLKLADIVITTTAGGPGGATDTVSSFIYREYRDRSNVGYGSMLAMVYLILIIVFVSLLLKLVSSHMQKMT
jgi:multiple sugar transport system permease protein